MFSWLVGQEMSVGESSSRDLMTTRIEIDLGVSRSNWNVLWDVTTREVHVTSVNKWITTLCNVYLVLYLVRGF